MGGWAVAILASLGLSSALLSDALTPDMNWSTVRRNFDESQGDTRRAEEVPAGANLQAMNALHRLHENRLKQEAVRLAGRYPERW